MRELLEQYRETACRLKVRKDWLTSAYREGGGEEARSDLRHRLRHVGEMYWDVLSAVREIKAYIGEE